MIDLTLAEQAGAWKLLAVAVGRLHIVVLHFPVALLIVGAMLEVWACIRERGSGRVSRAAGVCIVLGAALGVVSGVTGWLLAGLPGHDDVLEIHRWLGTAAGAVGLLALWLRVRLGVRDDRGQVARPGLVIPYRAVVVLGAALVGVAGHFGGTRTHGDGFLTKPWIELVKGGKPGGSGGSAPGTVGTAVDPVFARAWSVLESRCVECHGPDKRKGGLRVDSLAALLKGGKHGPSIVVGNGAKSYLIDRVNGVGPDEQMPTEGELLTDEQVGALVAWIDAGAVWPKEQVPADAGNERAEQQHWAYVPPVQIAPPAADGWGRNAIDGFVMAGLKKHGLKPSGEASKGVLLRRLTLDLTGLPPTVDELDAFERDSGPDAYEKVVDRLLESPAFGERWARPWLDLARYGDSRGYEKDQTWSMWPYRDWVINALNADMPYDRFTVEQIAGDLLPNATEQQRVATGFQRLSMLNEEGGVDPEEARVTAVVDRVDTTATVWLGATMACARCHDHKFDPVSMKDYYGFFAYFNSTAEETKTVGDGETHLIAPTLTIDGVPGATVGVMQELQQPRETRIMRRGDFRNPGDLVKPFVPATLAGTAAAPTREDRLGLAEWIVDKGNPLTARVHVNRLWSVYFGRGLVETEEDFGTRGSVPSHQELLDWLACEFMESGWSQKRIHRLIVTSATYRQSSAWHVANLPHAEAKDPGNVWLSRGPRFRLEAEAIRDQALALGGLLSSRYGGPSVKPMQPGGVWGHAYSGEKWVESTGEDRYRRGLYTFIKRATPYPSMAVFDAPSRQVTCSRRVRSNTPLQALTTLNDPVFVEAAAGLAKRVVAVRGDDASRIGWVVRACTARAVTQDEQRTLLGVLASARSKYSGRAADARLLVGLAESVPDADAIELAVWTVIGNVMLNLDEVLCKG